jgi:hypothetical protein
MKAVAANELSVVEVFHFEDGRTVFVGPFHEGADYIPACRAKLLVNGRVVATLSLEGEMMPNGRHPQGYRSVSTTDAIDSSVGQQNGADIRLRLDLPDSAA